MIQQNKQFIRNIFAGVTERHGFICRPTLIPLAEIGDFTLSSKPVNNWIPWIVENYERQVKSLEFFHDDNVPFAKLSTGTHIFAQAFGCDLLCAMLLEADAVKRLSDKCALLLKNFLFELRKEFPTMSPCHCPDIWTPPELGPWVSNDEVGTMSPAMFEEFCLPELNDLSETFGGIGMHCCADAEHQFPGFNKIKNFYAFNRVSDKCGYLPLLEHFTGSDGPVHCLAWVSDEDMEELINDASAGSRFIFVNMDADKNGGAEWLANARKLSAPIAPVK